MKRPSFQFYPKDLLSDTEAMAMPNEAMGIYFKLLCYDWVNDGIPDDPKMIMRIGGFEWTDLQGNMRNSEDYDIVLKHIYSRAMAHPSKNGFLTNPRLQKEREKQDDFSKKKVEAGKKGAKNRWQKPKNEPMAKNSTAIVLPIAKNGSSSSSSNNKELLRNPLYVEASLFFFERLKNWLPEAKGDPQSKAWLDPIRLMVEADGITLEQVAFLTCFVHGGTHHGNTFRQHSFWGKVTLSPSSLRKNAPKLIAEIRAKKTAPKESKRNIVFTSNT